jgi:hypothetical protein
MAKHPMTDVMNQRCCQCHFSLVLPVLAAAIRRYKSINYAHQLSGCMKNSDRMCKPRMRRTRKNQFRKSQLPNPTQALKWRRLYHPPHRMFELICVELDQVVQGVAYSLCFDPTFRFYSAA